MGWFGRTLSGRPLWYQLLVLALVTALPLLLSSYLMFTRLVANERYNIRQGLQLNARTLAALVDSEIDTHTAIATTLAHSPMLANDDLQAFWRESKEALAVVPGSWITISAPNGDILLNTLEPYGKIYPSAAAPQDIVVAFDDGAPKIGDLLIGPISKRLRALVNVPVYRDKTLRYVVSISLVPERFLQLIKGKYPPDVVVGVIDRNLKFVARVPDHEGRVGTLASEGWRAGIAAHPEGIIENRTLEGDWSLTAYVPANHGWTVGVAQLESSIQSPLRVILWTSLAMSAALAGLSMLFATYVTRNVNRGMQELARAAQVLGKGHRLSAFSAPFSEADTVVKTLVQASDELDRRGKALELANTQLEAKVEERTTELQQELHRREQAEAILRQAQKIETIGQLTGGIAHDFNNMLTVIIGNLDTVQRRSRKLDGASVLDRPVDAALQGARNAAKLTRRLLAFARQQPLEPEALSLNGLISGMADMMVRTVGENIRMETVLGAGLWPVYVDANQVENALANLIVNARDAMPDGGKLTVETANAYLDETYASRFGDVLPGQYVQISVTDAGTGIEKEKLERIFEPFFTTKAAGKGTGLGLAMVHGFVKQSGGHVSVYSEVGHGTTVTIYLPRYSGEEQSRLARGGTAVPVPDSPRARENETILLVEDDHDVGEYAIAALEDLGYRVISATDGQGALTAFAAGQGFDLLFTDVVLTGDMNGRQLADRIRATNPNLPVLFTTGYSRNAIFHHGRLDSDVNLLNKPYARADLARKVRLAIDSAAKPAALQT